MTVGLVPGTVFAGDYRIDRPLREGGMGAVYVPAGMMKISAAANLQGAASQPAAFCLDVTEVSAALFWRCREETPESCKPPNAKWHCFENGRDLVEHPANCVDWASAAAYCLRRGARLPTEEEWTLAASAAAGSRYPWGSASPTRETACLNQNSTCPRGSHPKDVSHFGVLDLGGNVSEWTSTVYCQPADKTCKPGFYKLKGGSYADSIENAPLNTSSTFAGQEYNGSFIGFRCAQSP